jgi:hypothetical protein
MSLLFEPCIPRLAAGKVGGTHLVEMFEALAAHAETSDKTSESLIVCYLDSDDNFPLPVIGQYVPELHLVVRRIEPNDGEDSDG